MGLGANDNDERRALIHGWCWDAWLEAPTQKQIDEALFIFAAKEADGGGAWAAKRWVVENPKAIKVRDAKRKTYGLPAL